MAYRIADVSNYQAPSNGDYNGWFNALKTKYDVKSVCILLSQGTSWKQPVASYQAYNAYKVFGNFSAYHFFTGKGEAEANNFLDALNKIGADKSTVVMIDAETPVKYMTTHINKFIDTVYDAGYQNIYVYSNESSFKNTIYGIKVDKLHHNARVWVANVSNIPSIKHDAWQYTWNGNVWGIGVDLDWDDTGLLAHGYVDKPKPSPYWKKGSLFTVITDRVNVYETSALDSDKVTQNIYTKGTQFEVDSVVKYGDYPRLKTKAGYITSNKKYVKRIK